MIPKIIHYCWFGGKEKPKSVIKMINSWKKYCPEYEIKEWNEGNFNININQYTKEAHDAKKWAFVSDVARLFALYTDGGIYMDTDVEVVKSLDALLSKKAFAGFEGTEWIGTNIIGAEKGNLIIEEFLNLYNNLTFVKENNSLNTITNVERFTALLTQKHYLKINGSKQELDNITIYPADYFCPYDYINGKLSLSNSTYSIHWYSQSWIERESIKRKLLQLYHRALGIKMK